MEVFQGIANIVTSFTVIATVIALFMNRSQIMKSTKATVSSNHLELRKLFSEEKREGIHSKLRPGGAWSINSSGHSTQQEWIDVEDYLGVFETAEFMLESKTLDDNLFRRTYQYRLQNIKSNKIIMKKINALGEDWDLFNCLLKRYNL